MRRFLAFLFLLLCLINLFYELFFLTFQNGFQALLTIGITMIGLYLAWHVMTEKL